MIGPRRTTLASPRLVYQKKKLFKKRIVWSVLVFAALMVTLVLMSRISSLQIQTVQVVGNEAVAADAIKSKAEDELNQYYLWLFPKRNVLLYPDDAIASSVARNWSRIAEVKVNADSLSSLTISIKEKTPQYTWCGFSRADFLTGESDMCYFLDDAGIIFDKAPQVSRNLYLKMYGIIDTTATSTADPIGQPYLTHDERAYLLDFADRLGDQSLDVVRMYAQGEEYGVKDYEFILRNGIRIVFNSTLDPEKALLGLKTLANKGTLLNADYIDFRFENKVYYKSR